MAVESGSSGGGGEIDGEGIMKNLDSGLLGRGAARGSARLDCNAAWAWVWRVRLCSARSAWVLAAPRGRRLGCEVVEAVGLLVPDCEARGVLLRDSGGGSD